jgi:hypothetical protein
MDSPPPAIKELARRLIALETPRDGCAEMSSEAARVCERLRIPFAKLAGQAGYRSLISRALAIARAEVPGLDSVAISPDGSLTGLAEIEKSDPGSGAAIVVHLLNLLVTFIGEPVTLGLMRDGWPNADLEITPSNAEETT